MTQKAKEEFDKIRIERLMQSRDIDRDGIPDAFDCDPFDPTRDGFFGDVFRRVTSAARAAIHRAPIHPSRSRAAQRRAAVRRVVTPSIRRVTRAARSVIHRAPIHPSWERAARRRESVRREITRAVRPVTSRIREVREYVALPATARRERVAEGAKQFLATHQAQTRRMSDLSMRMHTATSRVARVIRGFERPVMERVSHVEESAGVRIPTPVKEFAAGVAFGAPATMVEMAGMVPGGVETLAKHPRVLPAATAYGTYEMGRGMWKGITEHPIRTAGEFIGMGAIAKGATEASAYSPVKIKPSVINFPEAKGISLGLETRRGAVTEFRPGVTVMPRAEKLVTLGTPKVIETAFTGKTVFTPKTALESRIIARSLGREGAKITEARAVRWETGKAKVTVKEVTPTIKDVLKQHDISEKSASVVLKTMKSHKGTLFGSIIQRAAGERGLTRIPRDFDVEVKNPTKFAEDVAAKINKAEGKRVVIAKDGTVTVRATGKKLFDIHAPDESPDISYLGHEEIAWGLHPEKLVKAEGLKMRSYSEQISRKLEGSMIVGQERTLKSPLGSVTGRIVPKHEGRIKDILDFYTGEKLSIEQLRARGKVKSATKAEAHLEKWLNTWGKDIATTIRETSKEQIKTGVPTEFTFDFAAPKRSLTGIGEMYPIYPEATAMYSSILPSISSYRTLSSTGRYAPSTPSSYIPTPVSKRYTPLPTQRYNVPPPPTPSSYIPTPVSKRYTPLPTQRYNVPPPPTTTYKVPPPIVSIYKTSPQPTSSHKVPPPPTAKESKRLLRKRRKHKPEYWQIRNPIANLQQMMFGRVGGRYR